MGPASKSYELSMIGQMSTVFEGARASIYSDIISANLVSGFPKGDFREQTYTCTQILSCFSCSRDSKSILPRCSQPEKEHAARIDATYTRIEPLLGDERSPLACCSVYRHW